MRTTPSTIALDVSLLIQSDLITPSDRAATGAVTAVVATAPARHSAAARAVAARSSGETLWAEASPEQKAAIVAAERVRPRRTSRFRSLSRARTRRLETVPTGRPRIRAASWWVFPSRSQSTTGPRNEPGSWLSSSSSAARNSSRSSSDAGLASARAMRSTRPSRASRRALIAFSSRDVLTATPYSQLARSSRCAIARALAPGPGRWPGTRRRRRRDRSGSAGRRPAPWAHAAGPRP